MSPWQPFQPNTPTLPPLSLPILLNPGSISPLATSLLRHTHPNLTSIRRLLQPTGRRIATKFGDGLPGFSRDSRPFHPVCWTGRHGVRILRPGIAASTIIQADLSVTYTCLHPPPPPPLHPTSPSPPRNDRLVDLVVKASTSRAEDPGFDSRLRRGDFSESSQSNDLKLGSQMARRLAW